MQLPKVLVGLALGAVVGLVAAVGLGALDTAGRDAPSTESTPTSVVDVGEAAAGTLAAVKPWADPAEVIFETTVLIPDAFTVDSGVAALEYTLVPLAPVSGVSTSEDDHSVPVAVPDRWQLTTTSGEVVEVLVAEDAEIVRFEVEETATREDIASVRVVGWRIAAPVGERQTLPVAVGATAAFESGTKLIVETVLEQSTSTIVQVEVEQPDDPWREIFAGPVDPGWRVAGRQEGGLQFIWEGAGVPSVVDLVQETPTWVPMPTDLVVWAGDE
jgi:hypothetical protein